VKPFQPVSPFVPEAEVDRVFAFANRIISAMGIYAQVFISIKQVGRQDTHSEARWCGDVNHDTPTRAPHIVLQKAFELMELPMKFQAPFTMLTTPVVKGLGHYQGGIRIITEFLDITIAVSKLDEAHDRLIAGCIMYAYVFQTDSSFISLHHIGRRGNKVAFERAISTWDTDAIVLPADDHQRVYRFVDHFGCYEEQQYFESASGDVRSRHWDFVVPDPEHFLDFLASLYGVKPEIWDDAGADDPVGMVMVMGVLDPTSVFAVMARRRWSIFTKP